VGWGGRDGARDCSRGWRLSERHVGGGLGGSDGVARLNIDEPIERPREGESPRLNIYDISIVDPSLSSFWLHRSLLRHPGQPDGQSIMV
jgi:hypothetical protein